jgi:N-acetylmuramoyl-L-alanine amidase
MKNTMKFIAVLGLAIFLSFAFKPVDAKKTIVIDAGHGGKDFGAQIGADLEKQIVENIADKIRLQNGGEVEIILLREDDSFMALSERVAKINEINPDLMISLHINASKNASENGINAYVSKQNGFYEQSLARANSLINKIANEKLAKGAVKEGNFAIIKDSKCPAFLIEVGYLSNENDKNYITSESGQHEIAGKILEFVNE